MKLRFKEDGTIIERSSLDAKECLACGSYEEVGNEAVEETVEVDTKSVKTMNTEEITAYVAENNIVIEGFEAMNLKDKRSAVIAAVAGE